MQPDVAIIAEYVNQVETTTQQPYDAPTLPLRPIIIAEEQTAATVKNDAIKVDEFDYKKWDRFGTGYPPFPPVTYRFLPDLIAWLFGCYGYTLGKMPWLFLAIGILTGLGASAGLLKLQLSDDSEDLVNQFLEEGSRYFSDDDVIAAWRNKTQELNSLSNSAYANKPAGSSNKNRKKRQVEVNDNVCDWYLHSQDWRFEAVIIVAKNDSLVNQETMEEAFKLVYYIRELLQCDLDDNTYQASRIFCCDSWDLLRMKSEIYPGDESVGEDAAKLMTAFFSTVTYPADKRFRLSETIFTNSLGGVTRRDTNNGYNARITGIKAMQFQYFMPLTWPTLDLENKLTRRLNKIRSQYKHVDIYWETHMQTQDEFMRQIVFQELPKVAITFICVIIWCIIGAFHTDALNSKPWYGLLGIASTGLACAAGFGARFWTSDDVFQTFLIAVPLMALAIGLDDMFILMNSWHNTEMTMPREERAKRTMQEGGTSIFVTVMMTILDFVVGTATPFPAIQTYSNFALWVLAFDFWLQMTIFVSLLVMSDSCEKKPKQACCCCCSVKRRTNQKIMKWSACNVMCCSYGRVVDEDELEKKAKQQPVEEEPKEELLYMNLDIKVPKLPRKTESAKIDDEEDENEFSTGKLIIYKHVAPFLLHPASRAVIITLAGLFLAGSVIFVWQRIDIGFHPAHLCNRKSNTYEFKLADWKYFRDFTDALQLEILLDFETGPYDGDFTRIRGKVMEIVDKIEMWDSYIWGSRLNRVPFRDVIVPNATNVTLEQGVQYIADRTSDIAMKPRILNFQEEDERIVTLNTFQIKDVSRLERGAQLASRLKELQAGYEMDGGFKMYITDLTKVLRVFDQIVNLPSQFVYFTLITVASTVLTAFIMIPNPICIFWMSLSSMAITIGTIAGMALWEVSLDPVSLVYILMAVGATADYICHCIYTFTVIEADMRPDEARNITWATIRYRKARHLLAEVISETGPAVIGTTLSIVVLSTSYNYVLESFFKVFFIAVIVGVTFSMVVLPPIMCQFGPVAKTCCEKEMVDDDKPPQEEEPVPDDDNGGGSGEKFDHFYVNNRKALDKQRRILLKSKMLASKHDKMSNGGDHRQMVIDDGDYEDLMKIRLMRRFLHEARHFRMSNVSESFDNGDDDKSHRVDSIAVSLQQQPSNETNSQTHQTNRHYYNYSTIGDVVTTPPPPAAAAVAMMPRAVINELRQQLQPRTAAYPSATSSNNRRQQQSGGTTSSAVINSTPQQLQQQQMLNTLQHHETRY